MLALTEDVESLQHPPERIAAGPVLLRRLCEDDADAIADAVLASMKHLEPWMPWAKPASADVANQRSRIAEADGHWETGSDFIYSVLPSAAADGEVAGHGAVPDAGTPPRGVILGTFGLHRRVGPGAIEMGYWIHADHAGRGYGTAAARALTRAALALPGIGRVEIHCDAANVASAAIARKLGYRLGRLERRQPAAPGETGQVMIWEQDTPPPA